MIREDFRIEPADWITDLAALRAVRDPVFLVEQRVPESEEVLGLDATQHREAAYTI